jgi:hypothetical protein
VRARRPPPAARPRGAAPPHTPQRIARTPAARRSGDFNALRGDLEGMRGDLRNMRGDVKALRKELHARDGKIAALEKELGAEGPARKRKPAGAAASAGPTKAKKPRKEGASAAASASAAAAADAAPTEDEEESEDEPDRCKSHVFYVDDAEFDEISKALEAKPSYWPSKAKFFLKKGAAVVRLKNGGEGDVVDFCFGTRCDDRRPVIYRVEAKGANKKLAADLGDIEARLLVTAAAYEASQAGSRRVSTGSAATK